VSATAVPGQGQPWEGAAVPGQGWPANLPRPGGPIVGFFVGLRLALFALVALFVIGAIVAVVVLAAHI
jgi:hypothetical protein